MAVKTSCSHSTSPSTTRWTRLKGAAERYECNGCGALGYRRGRKIVALSCGHRFDAGGVVRTCRRPAVSRIWVGTVEMFRCADHPHPEAAARAAS